MFGFPVSSSPHQEKAPSISRGQLFSGGAGRCVVAHGGCAYPLCKKEIPVPWGRFRWEPLNSPHFLFDIYYCVVRPCLLTVDICTHSLRSHISHPSFLFLRGLSSLPAAGFAVPVHCLTCTRVVPGPARSVHRRLPALSVGGGHEPDYVPHHGLVLVHLLRAILVTEYECFVALRQRTRTQIYALSH